MAAAQPVASPTIQSVTLQPATTPSPMVFEGVDNTAIGIDALASNQTGVFNTASGAKALFSNIVGDTNTANGQEALYFNIGGFQNTATGAFALYFNTEGSENTANGVGALFFNEVGNSNTAYGLASLRDTTGYFNTAVGRAAGILTTMGSYNLMLGAEVYGDAADTNTIRIGLPDGAHGPGTGQNQTFIAGIYGTPLSGTAHAVYVDANGQLGTVAVGGAGGFLPMSQLQQQVSVQRKQLRDQEAVNAELRARLARIEALLAKVTSAK